MARYDSVAEIAGFRTLRPERFDDYEQYIAPAPGRDRPVDDAPKSDAGGRPLYANRGFQHLKGR